MSNSDTIKQLNEKIRQLQRPQSKPDSEFHETLTGIEAFDALLPAGGLSGGTLIEWLSPQGGGGSTLAMALASKLLRSRGEEARSQRVQKSRRGSRKTLTHLDSSTLQPSSTLVVIDSNREFYPPAITNYGVSLSQVVIIRPRHIGEAIWAFEQSLRCSGVTITMAWIDHLTDQTFRRLQLATEAGGGVGFLFRPTRMRKQRSWADARFLVEPANKGVRSLFRVSDLRIRDSVNPKKTPDPFIGHSRRLSVQLLHCRGRIEGGQIELEINNETGDVHLASRLAAPETQPRKARA